MPKQDLKTFEKRIRVRRIKLEDFEDIVKLQESCFPGMPTWSREHFESQLKMFPEGQVCVEYRKKIVASAGCLIVDFEMYDQWHNWKLIADSGYIRNHDYEGDTMYGIEIMVDPKYRGMKLSRRLYNERKELAKHFNLKRIIIGGRIPGYGKVADKMTAREYVEDVMDKTLYDQVLTAQVANGFVLKRLIPDYLPSDSESRGYATFLEWSNLDYQADLGKRSTKKKTVRVCAVQYQMRRIIDFAEFERQCEFFIDVASDYKCDFILFPELFTAQLLSLMGKDRPGMAARRLAEFTPQYLEFFTRMAVRYNVNIIGGSQFLLEEDYLYNVSYLFRRDGTLARQAKLHITPNERRWWGVWPGKKVEVFNTDCGKINIQVCYDVEFPEISRIAAAKGARIIFVPYNTDERHGYLRVRYCAQARCVENHMYVVIAGCTGNLPFVENADIHYAQSGVFTPSDMPFSRDGVASECTANIETLVMHDLDMHEIERHRIQGTTQNWNDRRLDMYRVTYNEDGEEKEV